MVKKKSLDNKVLALGVVAILLVSGLVFISAGDSMTGAGIFSKLRQSFSPAPTTVDRQISGVRPVSRPSVTATQEVAYRRISELMGIDNDNDNYNVLMDCNDYDPSITVCNREDKCLLGECAYPAEYNGECSYLPDSYDYYEGYCVTREKLRWLGLEV